MQYAAFETSISVLLPRTLLNHLLRPAPANAHFDILEILRHNRLPFVHIMLVPLVFEVNPPPFIDPQIQPTAYSRPRRPHQRTTEQALDALNAEHLLRDKPPALPYRLLGTLPCLCTLPRLHHHRPRRLVPRCEHDARLDHVNRSRDPRRSAPCNACAHCCDPRMFKHAIDLRRFIP